jgi:serpin B
MSRASVALRSFLVFSTLLLFASSASGCSAGGSSDARAAKPVPAAASDLQRDTSPRVSARDSAALVDANTAFAVDAYRWWARARPGQSVFFSPYSVSMVLAMTYAGAAGATASEMAAALHTSLSPARLQPVFDALDLRIAARSPQVALHVASSLWGAVGETYAAAFLDTLATNYGVGIRLEDFARDPDGSRARINAWVSDRTQGAIENLLGPGAIASGTRLVLVNAIAFQGAWAAPFRAGATATAPFTRGDGRTANVATMHAGDLAARFDRTATYDAVELAYQGGRVVMDVVVPTEGSMAPFEAGLTANALASITGGLKTGVIELWLPKFAVRGGSMSFKRMLQDFGMHAAFDARSADFSAIAVDAAAPLYVDDVVHDAYVEVDERGTRAAAATGVGIAATAALRPQETIRVDRPFLFAVRDRPTGTLLFVGRVMDPSAP